MKSNTLSLRHTLCFLLLIFGLITASAHTRSVVQNVDLDRLAEYIEQVRQTWRIPGLSVSIVQGDSTVFAEGFGSLHHDRNVPTQSQTMYHIGSVSKSFTAAVIASMVDEGLLAWTDRVKTHLPEFVWPDPWVEEHLLVRDLFLHSTGLRGQAGTYLPNLGYSRDEICAMIGRMQVGYTYRGDYQYNNVTFLVANQLIEKLTGKSWEENLQERIFNPLGMHRTTTGQAGYLAAGDRASLQHEFLFDPVDTVRTRKLEGDDRALAWLTTVGPAGGICSDVEDMTQWIRLHLSDGEVDGVRILSEKSMRELHRGRTMVSQDSTYIRLYGLCWFVEQNNEYQVIFHTGTTWGHTAVCAFVPEMGLGLMVLCNSEVNEGARYSIMRRIIDAYRGAPEKDWNREYFDKWVARNYAAWEKEQAAPAPVLQTACPNDALVGRYVKDELFGDAYIFLQDGDLYIRVGSAGWERRLEFDPAEGYYFWSDGHRFPVTFELDEAGKAKTLNVAFNYRDEGLGGWVRSLD